MNDEIRKYPRIALVAHSLPSLGGGHRYERDIIASLRDGALGPYEVTLYCSRELKNILRPIAPGLEISTYSFGLLARILMFFRRTFPGYFVMRNIGLRYGRFERSLRRKKVEIAYFLSPNPIALDIVDTNIITTVWDLGHRDIPEFLEISGNRHFEEREYFYRSVLPKSFRIVVDSSYTSNRIQKIYGISKERVIIAGLIQSTGVAQIRNQRLLDVSGFGNNFLIYPAQFWSHKQHELLISAFSQASQQIDNARLFLAGGDQGNLSRCLELVDALRLKESVKFLGFIDEELLYSMIRHAKAVVFPSALGPSNLPVIEAAICGTPIVVGPNLLDDQVGEEYLIRVPDFTLKNWSTVLAHVLTAPKPKIDSAAVSDLKLVEKLRVSLLEFPAV